MTHQPFVTVGRGLNRDLPPLRLYEKAKKLGIWNPSAIDFSQDIRDWAALTAEEQQLLLHLTALFQAGEEAVTVDLLPLIMVIAGEGRLEEEMYLTTFLFEEAKHTDFFSRMLQEIAGEPGDLHSFHSPDYRAIFYEALPQTMSALLSDQSPEAQIRASVTYNMIVEGVLAETGYHGYFTVLDQRGILPGVRQGITLLKQDESRHIAYGVFLISRLLAANPGLWDVVEAELNRLLPPALGIIGELFQRYDPVPFDLSPDLFVDFALAQFQKRVERLEKARGASMAEIYRLTDKVINTGDS
jgi:ribonucleoside-diphosphate reductase beta chain